MLSLIHCLDKKSQLPDLFILDGEFVVIGDFLPNGDGLFRVNDDLTGTVNLDHFGVTVWLEKMYMTHFADYWLYIFYLAGMVYEPGKVTTLSGIHDTFQVNSK